MRYERSGPQSTALTEGSPVHPTELDEDFDEISMLPIPLGLYVEAQLRRTEKGKDRGLSPPLSQGAANGSRLRQTAPLSPVQV